MGRVDCRPVVLLLASGLSAAAPAQEPAQRPAPTGASSPHSGPAPAAATRAGTVAADSAGRVSVWVDLQLPELASLARAQPAQREALRQQIQAQQDEVMARLRDLGALEQARVQQVRNALAVRLPAAQLDAARTIPGVRAVRRVRDIERGPLVHGD